MFPRHRTCIVPHVVEYPLNAPKMQKSNMNQILKRTEPCWGVTSLNEEFTFPRAPPPPGALYNIVSSFFHIVNSSGTSTASSRFGINQGCCVFRV